jgi:hypothetical protein
MIKARSRDCKHSYINYSTGSIHCHKKCGGVCETAGCTSYKRENIKAGNSTHRSNQKRLERMM